MPKEPGGVCLMRRPLLKMRHRLALRDLGQYAILSWGWRLQRVGVHPLREELELLELEDHVFVSDRVNHLGKGKARDRATELGPGKHLDQALVAYPALELLS